MRKSKKKKILLHGKLPGITEESLLWHIRGNYFLQFAILASRFKQISFTAHLLGYFP